MKKNVLIFPCGSGIGLEICQALYYDKNINLIGCSSINSNPNPSIFWLKKYYDDLPLVNNDNIYELINSIQNIIVKENIHYIFPGSDDVIIFFTKNCDEFKNVIILSAPYSISKICKNI